jgi:hypothetical protein
VYSRCSVPHLLYLGVEKRKLWREQSTIYGKMDIVDFNEKLTKTATSVPVEYSENNNNILIDNAFSYGGRRITLEKEKIRFGDTRDESFFPEAAQKNVGDRIAKFLCSVHEAYLVCEFLRWYSG